MTLVSPSRKPYTQVQRLVRYLRLNPGATAMQLVTELRMPKYTSRISDARQQGIDIECVKEGGLNRYYVRDTPVQTVLFG